jgi:hypothetical protein
VFRRKSKAVIMVADGAGGMAKVEDRRFEPIDQHVSFEVPKEQADNWFHYFDAECGSRGWNSSEMGQHDRRENSGSITINAVPEGRQLAVVWERKRGGPIKFRAASTGPLEFTSPDIHALFERISDQCKSNANKQFYRRGQLYYNGVAWRGELWLDDTTRLGPPSQQYEEATRGPRVVLVDATVDAAGPRHANHLFSQYLQEVSAFLTLVIGQAVHAGPRSQQSWTSTIVDGKIICDVRFLGYVETQNPMQMPIRGTHEAVPLHAVTRPDFSSSVNSFIGASELSLPMDVVDLWKMYGALTTGRRRQFLQAIAKWQEALMQSPDRHTLSFALMVVACEALKPSDREFDRHNINDVIEALLGHTFATRLKSDWFRAQYVRSVHLHLGEFLSSEFRAEVFSRLYDPTFDSARRELTDITQAAIIEWLRKRGTFSMRPLQGKKARVPLKRARAIYSSKARDNRSL